MTTTPRKIKDGCMIRLQRAVMLVQTPMRTVGSRMATAPRAMEASWSLPFFIARTEATLTIVPFRFETGPTNLVMTTNGLRLLLTGMPGQGPLVISASPDLILWEPLFTNPPTLGPLDFTDPSATNRAWRFYRAEELR